MKTLAFVLTLSLAAPVLAQDAPTFGCRELVQSPPARFEAQQRREFAKLLRVAGPPGVNVQRTAACFGRAMRKLQDVLSGACLLFEGPSEEAIAEFVERAAELCLPEPAGEEG